MSKVLTYDPSSVIIQVCDYQLTGVMSVEVTFNNQFFNVVKGIRGVHTRVYNDDTHCTVKIVLDQTSISNDLLGIITGQDRTHQTGRLKFVLKDTAGNTNIQSNQAFITGAPVIKFGHGFENREWTIELLKIYGATIGGNPGAGFDVFSSIEGALSTLGSSISDTLTDTFGSSVFDLPT